VSFTFWGSQLGAPATNLELRIRDTVDGYAGVREEVQQALAADVAARVLDDARHSLPEPYADALSLPEQIGVHAEQLQQEMAAAENTYGIRLPEGGSVLAPSAARAAATAALPPVVSLTTESRDVTGGTTAAARWSMQDELGRLERAGVDPRQISVRRTRAAALALAAYRSRPGRTPLTLLRVEGGRSVVLQAPKVVTGYYHRPRLRIPPRGERP
jgi:hypothetical protein